MQNAPFHAAGLNGLRLWFFCPCMAHPHASCSLPQRPETVIFLPIHGSPSCSACIIHYSTLWRGSSRKTELSLEDAMKKAPINEWEWSQHHINITCRWYLLQGYSLQCIQKTESREDIDPIIQYHLFFSIQYQVCLQRCRNYDTCTHKKWKVSSRTLRGRIAEWNLKKCPCSVRQPIGHSRKN